MGALPRGSLEVIGAAGAETCDYLISPVVRPGAHPVLFLLHGHQEISRVERLERLLDGPDSLDRFVLDNFTVVLPVFRWDGALLHDHAVNVEALWALVQSVLRRLGSHADTGRVYFTGYSMGADALMKLACRYGSHMAAVAPFAGSYDAMWYEPEEEMLFQLRHLAIRAYHSGRDNHVSPRNAWRMMKWLGGECGPGQEWREIVVEDPDLLAKAPPEHEDIAFDVTAFDGGRKEHWSVRDAVWHNCWECVYHHESTFGLFHWLLDQHNSSVSAPVINARFKATLELPLEGHSRCEADADAPAAPVGNGTAVFSRERGACRDLLPGKYRIIDECVVGSGVRLDTADICELDPGAEVSVLEVAVCAEDRRVRGRLESPAGWISLLDMDVGGWWVWPLEPAAAEAAPPPGADSAEPPPAPEGETAAALHSGVSSLGRLLVGTSGDGAEPGPLAAWNRSRRRQGRRQQCICVGDEIVAVNGRAAVEEMLGELGRAGPRLQLELLRPWGCTSQGRARGVAPLAGRGGGMAQVHADPRDPGLRMQERNRLWKSLCAAVDGDAAERQAKVVPSVPRGPETEPGSARGVSVQGGEGYRLWKARATAPLPTWRVIGGVGAGGIVVRHGYQLTASVLGRLEAGARVMQLDIQGERLHYKKVTGEGPDIGWVSLWFKGRELLQRV